MVNAIIDGGKMRFLQFDRHEMDNGTVHGKCFHY